MFSTVNLGNIVLQRHCWFTGSCLVLASSLISYFPVVVVLVCTNHIEMFKYPSFIVIDNSKVYNLVL
jgi:hypothetical protein